MKSDNPCIGDAYRRKKIIDEYLNGEKVEYIAAKYKVHQTYPSVLARRYGLKLRYPERTRFAGKRGSYATTETEKLVTNNPQAK